MTGWSCAMMSVILHTHTGTTRASDDSLDWFICPLGNITAINLAITAILEVQQPCALLSYVSAGQEKRTEGQQQSISLTGSALHFFHALSDDDDDDAPSCASFISNTSFLIASFLACLSDQPQSDRFVRAGQTTAGVHDRASAPHQVS